jgi:hypothetical protein
MALKDSTFVDTDCWGDEGSIRAYPWNGFLPFHNVDLTFEKPMDNDCINIELSLDNCRFTNDYCLGLEKSPVELPIQS